MTGLTTDRSFSTQDSRRSSRRVGGTRTPGGASRSGQASEARDPSLMQRIAMGQDPNERERAILERNAEVASGWVKSSAFAVMASNAYALAQSDRDQSIYLGKADAFRHCLWNALLAYQVGEDMAKKLADAHELPEAPKDNNSNVEREMDLHNNRVGRRLGVLHSEGSFIQLALTGPFLIGITKEAIDSGWLRIVDRRDPNNHKLVSSATPGLP